LGDLLRIMTMVVYFASLGLAAAVVVNLSIPVGVKLLIFIGAWWIFMFMQNLYRTLGGLQEHLGKIEYWTRMTFITVHIRNEDASLPSAMERVQAETTPVFDLAQSQEELDQIIWIIGGLVTLVVLGAALEYGWFGPTGENWTTAVWDWLHPPKPLP
jgi:hypothetical protein